MTPKPDPDITLDKHSTALLAERELYKHSEALPKKLNLKDLVLMQILYLLVPTVVGTAAKLGSSQFVFWLVGILLFNLPVVIVAIYLNNLMPMEGGLYQWAKLGFNEFTGFMVAWNLWFYAIIVMPAFGLMLATGLSYAIGPSAAWMNENKVFLALVNVALVSFVVVASVRGFGVGKWIHNAGGLVVLLAHVILVGLALWSLAHGTLRQYRPLTLALPVLSFFSLVVFTKALFTALAGFEYVAILAGEYRAPRHTFLHSVAISAPLLALLYILGTGAVQAFVPIRDLDLVNPIPQALSIGFRALGTTAYLARIVIWAFLFRAVASASLFITNTARLPLAAGWDGLLPAWFTKLHPKYKTPVNSILVIGLIALGMGLVSVIGVGDQEAFQLLDNISLVHYALTYLVMFALPVIGLQALGKPSPLWLKIVSTSGFIVSLLFVVLSIFPIIGVQSRFAFSFKIIVVVGGANIIGASVFRAGSRKEKRNRRVPSTAS
jgi:amino acid transporter